MGEWETEERDKLWEMLSEGLDLCVRARKMDQMVLEQSMAKIGWTGSRSGTPHLWMQQQYDNDLEAWETKCKAYLLKHPYR